MGNSVPRRAAGLEARASANRLSPQRCHQERQQRGYDEPEPMVTPNLEVSRVKRDGHCITFPNASRQPVRRPYNLQRLPAVGSKSARMAPQLPAHHLVAPGGVPCGPRGVRSTRYKHTIRSTRGPKNSAKTRPNVCWRIRPIAL